MPRRIVDLSVPLMSGINSDPPPLRPQITFRDHAFGAAEFAPMAGLKPEDMLGGAGPASEDLHVTTHAGTHMDAPWHYHPTMNNGQRAITIDEVPLDWCMGPGVKLDFRALPDGHVVTAAEVEAELARIGRYYATESMLVWDGARYDAEATPEFGSDRLEDQHAAMLRGDVGDDRGAHRVF